MQACSVRRSWVDVTFRRAFWQHKDKSQKQTMHVFAKVTAHILIKCNLLTCFKNIKKGLIYGVRTAFRFPPVLTTLHNLNTAQNCSSSAKLTARLLCLSLWRQKPPPVCTESLNNTLQEHRAEQSFWSDTDKDQGKEHGKQVTGGFLFGLQKSFSRSNIRPKSRQA